MNKWKEFNSYENWKNQSNFILRQEYDEYIEKNYDWVQPDTYKTFDDFCMGKWQRLN